MLTSAELARRMAPIAARIKGLWQFGLSDEEIVELTTQTQDWATLDALGAVVDRLAEESPTKRPNVAQLVVEARRVYRRQRTEGTRAGAGCRSCDAGWVMLTADNLAEAHNDVADANRQAVRDGRQVLIPCRRCLPAVASNYPMRRG